MDILTPDTSLITPQPQMPMTLPPIGGNTAFDFNLIIPKPWSLADQDKGDLKKLRDEAIDGKVRPAEKNMQGFYNEYNIYADSWRVKPRKAKSNKPQGLFNSKSGETHRGSETLGTFWLAGMTAADPFFDVLGEGFDDSGNELTPEQLYAVQKVIVKQLQVSHYREKLMRSLRSVALLGTVIFEEPWVRIPYKNGQAYFEYTDLVFRSLLKTFFDTNVWDINLSSFMATVDFPDKYLLKSWAKADENHWDKQAIADYVAKIGDYSQNNSSNLSSTTGGWNRVNDSKQRAGYTQIDNNVFEFITYHGKLDTENPVIASYWESEGRQDDPADFDFTMSVLNGDPVIRFHETQMGTWRSRFKVATFKTFEDESLGYGVGRIGRRNQREIDITLSRASDAMMKMVYSMILVGQYAGLKANQLNINPNGLIAVDDVDQVKEFPMNYQAIAQALAMVAGRQESLRSDVGAPTNLQGIEVKSSATAAAIAQNEGFRNANAFTQIIAEPFVREHVETMHYNNLAYLDEKIWVAGTGEQKPRYYNKDNLPRNIGIEIKIVNDKDFNRAERAATFLKGLELWSSIRQNFPPSVNAIPTLAKEWFRTMDLDPNILSKPMPISDQLAMAMQQAQRQGTAGMPPNEINGEMAGAAGNGGNNGVVNTPKGAVPTSNVQVPGL